MIRTVEMPALEEIIVYWNAEKPLLRFHVEGSTSGDVIFRADTPEKLLAQVTTGYANALRKLRQQNKLIKLLTKGA